jgi:hypothetical protein
MPSSPILSSPTAIRAPTMCRTCLYRNPLPSTSSRSPPSTCKTSSRHKSFTGLRRSRSGPLLLNWVKSWVPVSRAAPARMAATSRGCGQCMRWRYVRGLWAEQVSIW